jgi:S-formylglutathione hydrolase FrmB
MKIKMDSLCRKILPFILMALVGKATAQQAGRVIEDNRIQSTTLGKEVRYTVYLPADYDRSQRSYPVVYLLHGFTDDNTGWLQFGEVNRYADKAIYDGTIPPMIIIMPNGDSSWYINSVDGKVKYEDFFTKEFIPSVEKIFRIRGQKKYRGIAGLSMGGYGTLVYALKHPDLFAAAAPLSAWVIDDSAFSNLDNDFYEYGLRGTFARGLKGKQRLNQHWHDNSVLHIVESTPADELRKVRYWIDCGDDDFLTKGNSLLHIALTEKKVAHEFRVRDGGHNWTYWRTGITDALQFIGWSFRQQ